MTDRKQMAQTGFRKLFKRKGSTTPHHIEPRRVEFDWSNTPLDWIPDQPFASHFINEINLLLPAGEFWFCRLYNQAMPYITDDKLREDVQAFIRQEAMHARAHGGAVEEYLNQKGIETASYTKKEDWLFETLLADEPFGVKVPKLLQKRWLVFRLGIIAAVEHMTCVLGNYVLENKSWDEAGADEVGRMAKIPCVAVAAARRCCSCSRMRAISSCVTSSKLPASALKNCR